MKKLERLRKEALKICEEKGHKMQPFSRKYRHWWYADCKNCGETVGVVDDARDIADEISGVPVEQTCKGK